MLNREESAKLVRLARVVERAEDVFEGLDAGLQVEYQLEGPFHVHHTSRRHGPCEIRALGLRVNETGWVQSASLKAEEYGVDRKAGFLGHHADVRRVVPRHILRIRAHHDRDDQGLSVNGVSRHHQDGSATSLFPAHGGAEVDEVDLTTANHP